MNVVAIALLAASVSVGSPYLVKDFAPDQATSEVQAGNAVAVGDVFFFSASDGGFWRSDGTELGTWRIADDAPGRRLSSAYARPLVVHDEVYYGVHTESNFYLYRTDGTTSGTHRLLVLPRPNETVEIAACGAKVCFTIDSELGVSDGTAEGTSILPLVSPTPTALTTVGPKLYFRGRDGLWVSDGTAAGTRLVKAFGSVGPLAESAGKLFFTAPDPEYQGYRAVWVSDGTEAGTRRLARLLCNSCVPQYVTFRDRTYIAGLKQQVLRTDGTPEGTVEVQALPAFCEACGFKTFSLLPAGESLVLHVTDSEGRTYMWSFDGEHEPQELASGRDLLGYLPATKRWYYTVGTGDARPKQLWSSDGTTDEHVGTLPDGMQWVRTWGATPSRLVLSDGPRKYIVEGTTNEVRELRITRRSTAHSDPFALFGAGDKLYFGTNMGDGVSLRITDGTDAGTTRLSPVIHRYGKFSSDAGRIFFRQSDVWITDGTNTGTRSLEDTFGVSANDLPAFLGETPIFGTGTSLARGNADGSVEILFTTHHHLWRPRAVGNRVLFWAGTNTTGDRWALHVNDGTKGGTVAQLPESHRSGSDFLVDGNRAFFGAWMSDFGPQTLWMTDGTPAGTKSIRSDLEGGFVPELMWNGIGYFRVTPTGTSDGTGQVWRTDGTRDGTYPLTTATFTHVTLVKDRLVLVNALDGTVDIWTSDGTRAGTNRHRQDTARSVSRPFPLPNGGIGIALVEQPLLPHPYPLPSPSRFEIYDITSNSSTFVSLGAIRLLVPDDNTAIHYANGRLFFIGGRFQGSNLWAVPLSEITSAEPTDVDIAYAGLTRLKTGWGAVFRITSDTRNAEIPVVVAETIAGTLREDIDYQPFTSTLRLEDFAEATLVVPIRQGASGTMSIALTAVSGARVVHGFATAIVPGGGKRRAVSH